MTVHLVDPRSVGDLIIDNALSMDVRRDIRAPQPQVALRGAYHVNVAKKAVQVKAAALHCRTNNLAACREQHHRGDIFSDGHHLLEGLLPVTTAPVFNALIELAEHLPDGHACHQHPQFRDNQAGEVEYRQPSVQVGLQAPLTCLLIDVGHRHRQGPRVGLQLCDVRIKKIPGQADRQEVGLQRPEHAGLIQTAEEPDPVALAQIAGKKSTIRSHAKLALEVGLQVIQRGILEEGPFRFVGHVHHTGLLRVLRNRPAGKHQDAPQTTALGIQPLPGDRPSLEQHPGGLRLRRCQLAVQQCAQHPVGVG